MCLGDISACKPCEISLSPLSGVMRGRHLLFTERSEGHCFALAMRQLQEGRRKWTAPGSSQWIPATRKNSLRSLVHHSAVSFFLLWSQDHVAELGNGRS